MLELWQDGVRAVHVQAKQVLDPVIGVRTAARRGTYLRDPWPDRRRRRADLDCPGRDTVGLLEQLVSGRSKRNDKLAQRHRDRPSRSAGRLPSEIVRAVARETTHTTRPRPEPGQMCVCVTWRLSKAEPQVTLRSPSRGPGVAPGVSQAPAGGHSLGCELSERSRVRRAT